MNTLETITHFRVPANVLDETDAQLRAAGEDCVERFVLWTGVRSDDTFSVRTAHTPEQTAYRLRSGLCVTVDGPALHRLNVWQFERQEELAVQVHSHPTDAYHSETDDTFPIVTVRGGLSLVVPYFGSDGIRGQGVVGYRLSADGWNALTTAHFATLIEFEE